MDLPSEFYEVVMGILCIIVSIMAFKPFKRKFQFMRILYIIVGIFIILLAFVEKTGVYETLYSIFLNLPMLPIILLYFIYPLEDNP